MTRLMEMSHCPQNVRPRATDFRSRRVCIKVSALYKVFGEWETAVTHMSLITRFLLYIVLCSALAELALRISDSNGLQINVVRRFITVLSAALSSVSVRAVRHPVVVLSRLFLHLGPSSSRGCVLTETSVHQKRL